MTVILSAAKDLLFRGDGKADSSLRSE